MDWADKGRGKEERGAGTWDAMEDEALLQGQALDQLQRWCRSPCTGSHIPAAMEGHGRSFLGGAGTAAPLLGLGRSPTARGTRGEAAAALVMVFPLRRSDV